MNKNMDQKAIGLSAKLAKFTLLAFTTLLFICTIYFCVDLKRVHLPRYIKIVPMNKTTPPFNKKHTGLMNSLVVVEHESPVIASVSGALRGSMKAIATMKKKKNTKNHTKANLPLLFDIIPRGD